MWRVVVKLMPKPEVLDVEGRAIARALRERGYAVKDCRAGKLLELKVEAKNKKEALEKAQKMAGQVLCNRLVECYELELSEI